MFQYSNVFFYYYHIPGIIISHCWDVGVGLLEVMLQGKRGRPGAPTVMDKESRLLHTLRHRGLPQDEFASLLI